MIAQAVEALVASALLMAVVLLVRAPVRRAFGPGIAYVLWTLPVLRLALPPLPAAWHAGAAAPVAAVGERITVLVVAGPAPPAAEPFPTALVLAGLWAAGACLVFGWHVLFHCRFCRRLRGAATAMRVLPGGSVRLVESAACAGPLAFGLWRPTVVVPADFAQRYDAEERALALAHELGHHLRGDLFTNWIALAVLALHWPNPLAWASFRAFRADQEMANDAAVLARRPSLRHAYGRAIAKAACGGVFSPACHLHTVDDLKGRLKMLACPPASPRRLRAGTVVVATAACAALGLTAAGTPAAAAIGARVGKTMDAALPQVPAAPEVPAILPPPLPPAPPPPPPLGKARKHVVVVKDGKTTTYDGADADAYIASRDLPVPPAPPVPPAAPGVPPQTVIVTSRDGLPAVQVRRVKSITTRDKVGNTTSYTFDVPDISNIRCPGPDDARPAVESTGEGRTRRIVICTNRIERMAGDAEAIARRARVSARANLDMARAAIERDGNLTAEQRKQALAGIAQAETELASKAD